MKFMYIVVLALFISHALAALRCPVFADKGWDLSHWNNNGTPIDWPKVGKSWKFLWIILKATTGGTGHDESFVYNWNGMKSVNTSIGYGAYHYFTTTATPQEQIDNIARNLQKVDFSPTRDLFAVDFEKNEKFHDPGFFPGPGRVYPNEMADRLNTLLELLVTKLNIFPMVYTNNESFRYYINATKYNFNHYPLWLADYRPWYKRQIPPPWDEETLRFLQYGRKLFVPAVVEGLNDLSCIPEIYMNAQRKTKVTKFKFASELNRSSSTSTNSTITLIGSSLLEAAKYEYKV